MRPLPLVEPFGRGQAGGVGVEGEHDVAGEALQQAHVLLGEGRAAGGDGPGHPGPVEADHVGVALAHHDLPGPDDLGLGPLEAVEGLGLRVDGGLRRVLVLGRILAPGQHPAPEGHRVTHLVEDGEHHPGAEGVLQPVAAVREGQPDVAQQRRPRRPEPRTSASQSSGAQPSRNWRATSPSIPRLRR